MDTSISRLRERLCLDRECWQTQYLAGADARYERHLEEKKSYFINLGHKMILVKQGRAFLAPQLQALYATYQRMVSEDEALSDWRCQCRHCSVADTHLPTGE